jgi:hypothetical protein
MRIFLSGPMNEIEMFNYPAFDLNEEWLRDGGWDVVSPAELNRQVGLSEFALPEEFTDTDYHKTMIRNYTALLTCDAIAFMPGWGQSKGSNLERDLAQRIGLPMYRVDAASDYFEKELILGIGGYAKSGKDTLANLLVEGYGFERHAFADALKSVLYSVSPAVNVDGRYTPLKKVIDDFGWDDAKRYHPEIREIQQGLGNGVRDNVADNTWVRVVMETPHGPRLAIPDTRFPNESDAIHRNGGYVVRIDREGIGPVNNHSSESLDINPDLIIANNGKPEEMLPPLLEFLGNVL